MNRPSFHEVDIFDDIHEAASACPRCGADVDDYGGHVCPDTDTDGKPLTLRPLGGMRAKRAARTAGRTLAQDCMAELPRYRRAALLGIDTGTTPGARLVRTLADRHLIRRVPALPHAMWLEHPARAVELTDLGREVVRLIRNDANSRNVDERRMDQAPAGGE